MRTFTVFSIAAILMAQYSSAAPQYGGGGGGRPRPRPQPQRQCRTVNDVKYVEQFDNVCNTVYE